MSIKIKSLWHGQIGVHQKFVKDAIINNKPLDFKYKDERMVIQPENIKKSVRGISEESFRDRFKNELYKLVYFDWKPDKDPQQKLL